jgi:hypothetical protein
MCHTKDFKIGQEMSELWPFYLLFKAHNFADLLRAYFSSFGKNFCYNCSSKGIVISPSEAEL